MHKWICRLSHYWCVTLILLPISAPAQNAAYADAFVPTERIALVIGNSDYAGPWPALDGVPVRDADAVRAVLHDKLGFQVLYYSDLDLRQMEAALEDFRRALNDKHNALALVYFSGHGAQAPGIESGSVESYLIPARSDLRYEEDAKYKAIAIDRVKDVILRAMAGAGVIIVDACRENGLERTATKGVQVKGLGRITGAPGILVSYATAAGKVALNRVGAHSPYTEALLAEIGTPGVPLSSIFKSVRARVMLNTRESPLGTQNPEMLDQLDRDIVLVGSGSVAKMGKRPLPTGRDVVQSPAIDTVERPAVVTPTPTVLSDLEAALACSPALTLTAINALNGPRTARLITCNHDVLADERVYLALLRTFSDKDFKATQPFFTALKDAGVDLLRDYPPHGMGYNFLQSAVQSFNTEAVEWLVRDARPEDLHAYTTLLTDIMTGANLRVKPDENAAVLEMTRTLVKRGVPIDAGDYGAFRAGVARYAGDVGHMLRAKEEGKLDAATPARVDFDKAMYTVVEPPPKDRTRVFLEACTPERDRVLKGLDDQIHYIKENFAGRGLGFELVNGQIVVNTQMPPNEASNKRTQLAGLEAERAQLLKLLSGP